MLIPFRAILFFLAIVTGFITSYSVLAQDDGVQETVFDTLDGHGPSKKRVDVIEWEGNLEVHVYPKGGLGGLGAKLDDRTAGKRVMVIGYRFSKNKNSHPLVRRAILGVPFNKNLKAFIDPTETEFDKLALSNNGLALPWKPYTLDPAPAQWYPDGVEDQGTDAKPFLGSKSITPNQKTKTGVNGGTVQGRQPASVMPGTPGEPTIQDSDFDGEVTDKTP